MNLYCSAISDTPVSFPKVIDIGMLFTDDVPRYLFWLNVNPKLKFNKISLDKLVWYGPYDSIQIYKDQFNIKICITMPKHYFQIKEL